VRSDPRGWGVEKGTPEPGRAPQRLPWREADVLANYALPLHLDCDSFMLTFLARKKRERSGRTVLRRFGFQKETK
jgi:hypothetical protein